MSLQASTGPVIKAAGRSPEQRTSEEASPGGQAQPQTAQSLIVQHLQRLLLPHMHGGLAVPPPWRGQHPPHHVLTADPSHSSRPSVPGWLLCSAPLTELPTASWWRKLLVVVRKACAQGGTVCSSGANASFLCAKQASRAAPQACADALPSPICASLRQTAVQPPHWSA